MDNRKVIPITSNSNFQSASPSTTNDNLNEFVYNEIRNNPLFTRFSEFYAAYAQIASCREEGNPMDWQEKYLDKLDRDISEMKSSLQATEERITKQITQIVNQALGEMRDRDSQRHKEFIEINRKIDSKINSIENKIDSVKNKVDDHLKWIIATAISTIIGVAAMVITVMVTK